MDNNLRLCVEQLIQAFPDTYPSPALTEKEFAFRAGQIDIIRRLKPALNRQFD
jgi:hypothetical protein